MNSTERHAYDVHNRRLNIIPFLREVELGGRNDESSWNVFDRSWLCLYFLLNRCGWSRERSGNVLDGLHLLATEQHSSDLLPVFHHVTVRYVGPNEHHVSGLRNNSRGSPGGEQVKYTPAGQDEIWKYSDSSH